MFQCLVHALLRYSKSVFMTSVDVYWAHRYSKIFTKTFVMIFCSIFNKDDFDIFHKRNCLEELNLATELDKAHYLYLWFVLRKLGYDWDFNEISRPTWRMLFHNYPLFSIQRCKLPFMRFFYFPCVNEGSNT